MTKNDQDLFNLSVQFIKLLACGFFWLIFQYMDGIWHRVPEPCTPGSLTQRKKYSRTKVKISCQEYFPCLSFPSRFQGFRVGVGNLTRGFRFQQSRVARSTVSRCLWSECWFQPKKTRSERSSRYVGKITDPQTRVNMIKSYQQCAWLMFWWHIIRVHDLS